MLLPQKGRQKPRRGALFLCTRQPAMPAQRRTHQPVTNAFAAGTSAGAIATASTAATDSHTTARVGDWAAHSDRIVDDIFQRRKAVGVDGRHNFKLPGCLRQRLGHPYDLFLEHAMLLTAGLDPAAVLGGEERVASLVGEAPKGSDWTIWISTPLRDSWLDRKRTMHTKKKYTNAECLFLMLEMRDVLLRGLAEHWSHVRARPGVALSSCLQQIPKLSASPSSQSARLALTVDSAFASAATSAASSVVSSPTTTTALPAPELTASLASDALLALSISNTRRSRASMPEMTRPSFATPCDSIPPLAPFSSSDASPRSSFSSSSTSSASSVSISHTASSFASPATPQQPSMPLSPRALYHPPARLPYLKSESPQPQPQPQPHARQFDVSLPSISELLAFTPHNTSIYPQPAKPQLPSISSFDFGHGSHVPAPLRQRHSLPAPYTRMK
ncbi:hypothetical protein BC831DRAFT_447470 [Entophlyctis helioformis]|nr:hypothetical protein BC831DRAFT_447470 [Entophlyctis helioformis]